MAAANNAAVTAPAVSKEYPKGDDWTHGLKSNWPVALDLAGSDSPCRLEGEVKDLVCVITDVHIVADDSLLS